MKESIGNFIIIGKKEKFVSVVRKIMKNNCKKCKKKLKGIMIFNPELCFFCIAEEHCNGGEEIEIYEKPVKKSKKLLLF